MQSDRVRVSKSKFFGFTLPTGQTVVPYNGSLSNDSTGQEPLPPLELNGRLYLGTCNTGLWWPGSHNRFRTALVSGSLGQVPTETVNSSADRLYGLRGPMARHAVVRGFGWVPAVGNIAGTDGVNLVRLGGSSYTVTVATGSTATVSPPFALGPWNKLALAQGTADALLTFSIAADGTATYDGARALPIGATPNGVGAAVVSPSGAKVLAFGRDLENRNQICQSTDAITYAALPEAAISAGNPLRVIDALSIPAAGGRPAVILVSCLLAGVPRILRSTDDGVSYTLLALDSTASAEPFGQLHVVNGVVFCFHQNRFYISQDHGGTWAVGSASVIQPSRVDYDAALRCYILHLRVGAAAVLDEDLTYKGTIVPPSPEHFLAQIDPTIISASFQFSYAARGVNALTYYRAGSLFGLLRYIGTSSQDQTLFAYRQPLALMRLPNSQAEVTLVGGGSYGEMLLLNPTLSNPESITPYPQSGAYLARSPAGATQLLGFGAAAAGSLLPPPERAAAVPEIAIIESARELRGLVAVRGAAGYVLAGQSVGGGGGRQYVAPTDSVPPFSSIPLMMVGGYAGEVERLQAPPGALLAFSVGRGGRVTNAARGYDPHSYRRFHLSIGQDGGALVEWEEWA